MFEGSQRLRSSNVAAHLQKPVQSAEVEATVGQWRRANTAFASPTSHSTKEGDNSSRNAGRPNGDVFFRQNLNASPVKKKDLSAGLFTRPATSFDSYIPHQPLRATKFSKQSPEKRDTQRRQSSLDAQSTTQHPLSEARARLRSVGEEKAGRSANAPKGTSLSPGRRKTAIHELQNPIDDAIDEQAKPDIVTPSKKQSPRLKSIASGGEMDMASPTKRQSLDAEASGSSLRRGRSVGNSSRPRRSGSASTDMGIKVGEPQLLSSMQPTLPTRKQRLSTESVLPRSSVDSDQPPTVPYSSLNSPAEVKPGSEILQLHPPLSSNVGPSPVKTRAAAYEKMMQHDKHIMYDGHRHSGKVQVKKHWCLDPPKKDQTHYIQGKMRQEPIAMVSKTCQAMQRNPSASTRAATHTLRSGPIPLALPQLISSGGRAGSASSQLEDGFETAPESEAALSRLSSRMQSPWTIPKLSGAHEVGNEIRSPLCRWKPFMVETTLPTHKTFSSSSKESSIEANAGSDVPETQVAQIIDRANRLISKRWSLCPSSQNHNSLDSAASATTTTPKQDDGTELHFQGAVTKQSYSSGDMTLDGGKKVAVAPNDSGTEGYDKAATGTRVKVYSSRSQSKDTTPFPSLPAEGSSATSASGSPIRGRAAARALHRQSTTMRDEGDGSSVRVSRSRSKAGNVRVTVEVRTPQGSPVK